MRRRSEQDVLSRSKSHGKAAQETLADETIDAPLDRAQTRTYQKEELP